MNRKTKKGKNLKYLISKAILAEKESFYLETIFLCHSIIEERLRSTVLKTDSTFGKRHKIPTTIGRFKRYINNEEYLFDIYYKKDFLKKILKWKKAKRDPLMHELERNINIIDDKEKLELIAKEGINLMRELNATVMKWKRKAKKQKII